MNKHREVLERFLEQCEERQRIMSFNADEAKKEGHINDESYFQIEANEAQERINAIRHALEIMAKAETLPKTADGVTVWPGDTIYLKAPYEGVVSERLKLVSDGMEYSAWSCYSTEQAARDAEKAGSK